jgi:hypothetical protein
MYDMIPDETKVFFITLSLEKDMTGAEFYEAFFYVHEFGHGFQYQMDATLNTNRYSTKWKRTKSQSPT